MTVLATPRGRIAVKSSPFGGAYQQSRWWGASGVVDLVGVGQSLTYAGLYRSQPWLAAAVNKITRMIARLPIRALTIDPEGNPAALRDHRLPQVLAQPNPYMTAFRLKEWMIADVALYGNSTVRVLRDPNGEPTELYPMPWPLMEVAGTDYPELYYFHPPNSQPIAMLAEDVIHLRFWSPGYGQALPGSTALSGVTTLVGGSPVEPLRRTLINDDAAGRWSTAMFKNAGRPSSILTTDEKLSREQIALVRDELQGTYGGVDNAFKIAVMQGGLHWAPGTVTPMDAALVELRKLNREEVAAAYDIPPPMLQILDKATFSNVSEQHRNLYQDSLPPWIELAEGGLNLGLVQNTPGWSNIDIRFDLNGVLRGSPTERAAYYAVARRYTATNEIRKDEGLAPIGDPNDPANPYNQVFIPINEYPIGSPRPTAAPSDATPGDTASPGKTLAVELDRVEDYAAHRIGAGLNGFEPSRFSRELMKALARTDDACKVWADAVANAVGEAIHGASTAGALRERMGELRAALFAPEPEPAALPAGGTDG